MSPKRYLWLRRMNLARRALRRADPESTTVTEIATNYGFWELGRFSVAYRSLFGESPSTALRRPADNPNPAKTSTLPGDLPNLHSPP
jgi:AraC-like DNA-binding protein